MVRLDHVSLIYPSSKGPVKALNAVDLQLGAGEFVVIRGPSGLHALPTAVLAFVVAGGITYTLGAVVYALKRPNPFPRIFGFHEIWHLFVLGGSALHYVAMLLLALG